MSRQARTVPASALPWMQEGRAIELRLLQACIAATFSDQREACQIVLAAGRPNWIHFLTLALEHHTGGIAAKALSTLPADIVPPPVMQALTLHARHTAELNRAALQEQQHIQRTIEQAGLRCAPLKSAWLCLRAYGDLSARPSRDLDFLLLRSEVRPALNALASCGYDVDTGLTPRQFDAELRNNCEFQLWRKDRAFTIEPHWDIAPRNLALAIDMAAIWRRVRPMALEGMTFPTLSPEDEFILLCLHGGKEEWVRLKWLMDLAAFVATVPELDWQIIADRAQEGRVMRFVLLGVGLLDRFLAIRTPLSDRAALDRAANELALDIAAKMQLAATLSRGVAEASDIYMLSPTRMRLRERRRDRMRFVWRSLVTPRRMHYQMIRLPASLHGGYFVVKIVHDFILLPVWLLTKSWRGKANAKPV